MICLPARFLRAFAPYLVGCLLTFTLCLQAAPSARAQMNDAPLPLVAGKTITRELKGGAAHTYSITLRQGEFLRVVATSQGVDLGVTLYGPGDKNLLAVDLLRYPGTEPVSFEAEAPGAYRLGLRALGEAGGGGGCGTGAGGEGAGGGAP